MKQFSYRFRDKKELASCLEALRSEAPMEYKSVLASLYTADEWENVNEFRQEVEKTLPRATVVGTSSDHTILHGSIIEKENILVVQFFEHTVATLQVYDFDVLSPGASGKALANLVKHIDDLAGVELLTVPGRFNTKPFLDSLSVLPVSIPVFGGVANCEIPDFQPFVFARDSHMTSGVVVILFRSSRLKFFVYGGLGWKPLGVPMSITKLSDDGMTIEELDYQPAFHVYDKYLYVSHSKSMEKDLFAFPLMLERNGVEIARLPVEITPDEYLRFVCGFTKGEKLRLAYGDPEEILASSKRAQHYMAFFAPEAILFFDCVSRNRFMQDSAETELRPFESIAPNAGYFSHGEITRAGRNVVTMNMVMLTVGMREKAAENVLPLTESGAGESELTGSMSLVKRLASFITVVSKELEEANKKLERLARHDRLTSIYNRGEIESIMQDALLRNRELGSVPVSIIMLDIDNFKQVNDKYGHAVGDEVLKYTAKTLMNGMRGSDHVGRWGGEEFLIVLEDFSLDMAKQIAERLRLMIADVKVLPDGGNITASFGVAKYNPGEDFDDFYRRIDSALYMAKRSGKNCVATK